MGETEKRQGDKRLATTDRVYLRELAPSDAASLYSLNSDPDVMRYTGDTPFLNLAAARAFLQDYDQYRKHGFGRWAVIRKRDDRFIGWSGLRKDEQTGEVDLGFRYFAEFWAQGYATEAGRACLQLGFDEFGLDRIIGRSMRENLPSVTVLQKLGMEFLEVREDSGRLWLIYGIDVAAWRHLTSTPESRGR